jgi:hypothetical protein
LGINVDAFKNSFNVVSTGLVFGTMDNGGTQQLLKEKTASEAGSGNGGVFDDSKWHHLVAVRESARFVLYVDGLFLKAVNSTNDSFDATSELWVGCYSERTSDGDRPFLNGMMDEVALFPKRVLSIQEIYDMYARGKAKVSLGAVACNDKSGCGTAFPLGSGNNVSGTNLFTQDLPAALVGRYFQFKIDFGGLPAIPTTLPTGAGTAPSPVYPSIRGVTVPSAF